jgi:hypothetical protein
VCGDVGVVDDTGQVGLVPVDGYMLEICGHRQARIVGAEQDKLVDVNVGSGNTEISRAQNLPDI